MKQENRTPVIEREVNLSYTKGLYKFFCVNIAKIFCVVLAILEKAGNIARDMCEKLDAFTWQVIRVK